MRHSSLPPTLAGSTSPASVDELNGLLMSSDAENVIFTPPPRIAARFSRTTNRKSNTSSRRNSISSLHSSRSNRSGHGALQVHSTHVAQHLRRASIIETRKARLADRNAHAEMVRLRAQQAKALPRTNRSGEERALNAQQARERHLAQVAAGCAEEVKRAKKIAEETREKRAAEHLRITGDMEKRFADAEKRRILYQQNLRRGRNQTLSAVEEKKVATIPWKPKSRETAARVIQNSWRVWQRKRVVANFLGLNLDVERVQTTSFEDMSDLLAQERVLIATGKLLRLCGLQDIENGSLANSAGVRTFLAAYLVIGYPKQVFSRSGEQEEDLVGKAKDLLMQFQRILSKPPTTRTLSPDSELMISLTEAYGGFQTAFGAWKNHDSSMLVETMIAQFVELDAILQSVKRDSPEHVADDYSEGIKYNQTILLARLKRLAGPEKAFKMLNVAVRARRESKTPKKAVGDVKPRASIGYTGTKTSVAASSSTAQSRSDPPTQTVITDRSLQMSELNKVISPLPGNRLVVHELAINKDYKIDVDPASDMRQQVNRAVFNAMRTDLAAGLGDQWIVSMAEMIRDRLLRLVTHGNSLWVLISESLDAKLIENQLRIGAFSYEKFFSFMNNILPKLCAPVRDNEVAALAADSGDDFIERLAKLLHVIDLLALDYANYLLNITGPELIRRAPQYEQELFQEQLASGNLLKTQRWWHIARAHTTADLSRRSPDGSQPQALTSRKIYTTGLTSLFINLAPLLALDVPETLELDRDRIAQARSDLLRIITISSIILTAKNLLKRDVRTQWRTQAQRMWDLPLASAYADPQPYLSIIDESAHTLPPATRTALAGTVDRVLRDARSSPDITHPVMRVLLQKIKTHATARLAASSSEEKIRSASSASEVLSAGGMPEFVGRIGVLVEEMARVRQVDWDAHGKWLDQVAEAVAAEERAVEV